MNSSRNFMPLIAVFSVVLIGIIALLFFLPGYEGTLSFDVTVFPLLNAIFNGFTFCFLLISLYFIKRRNIPMHRNFILCAFMTTALFLVSYVIYHYLTEPTVFGGSDTLRYVYYFILISHVLLAIVNVPLALISVARGFSMQVERHRKIARWTMPVWLYVSSTGVIVYLLISPYY
ncbi:MAG: putative rane protein [Paenibacillus sp.]|nr:putative rane protein [Paenibacillus sp.]